MNYEREVTVALCVADYAPGKSTAAVLECRCATEAMAQARVAAAVMQFGQYRGTPTGEVPEGYLRWLLTRTWLHSATRADVRTELKRRGAWVPSEVAAEMAAHQIEEATTPAELMEIEAEMGAYDVPASPRGVGALHLV